MMYYLCVHLLFIYRCRDNGQLSPACKDGGVRWPPPLGIADGIKNVSEITIRVKYLWERDREREREREIVKY